jgi:thiol-disulfide isomerase/thioredoxin
MPKKNTLVVLALVAAALALVGAAHFMSGETRRVSFSSVSAAAPPAHPVDDPNMPVIRFVKDPEIAPPLEAQDISGRAVNKSAWGGKVVMINFWATWCPPCRMEIPELLRLKSIYGDQLEIVGISEDEDGPANVLKFAQRAGIRYPIVMATPELVASYGGVPALPTTFLIDTQGRVVQKHSGLYPIENYHLEIRSLLGLPIDARVETFVDAGQIFLKNAANATELPGVDFKGLTAEQKKQALHRMNAESCTCGCTLTLSQCRVNDTECPTSMGLAAQVVKDVVHGVKPQPPPVPKGTNSISQ